MPKNSCGWKAGLTKTFRNRSGKTINDKGTNLQNPSPGMCRIHTPKRGCSFIQPDLAGAEAKVVAMLTPPGGKFRQLFDVGIKPHVFVALHLFQPQWQKETPYDARHLCSLPISELSVHPEWKYLGKIIKNHTERYFIGKKTCHSFNYRKMPGTFRFDVLKESEGKIVLTLKDSEHFREVYVSLFPEIFEYWHEEVIAHLQGTRYIYNCLGYPHYFGGHVYDQETIRKAIATGPQSTVGCVANIAACDFQDWVEDHDKKWDLLNNKHDSLLAQAEDGEETLSCARKMCEFMGRVELRSPFGETFYMKTEVSVGKNWAKKDEDCYNCQEDKNTCKCGNYIPKNPEGMDEIDLTKIAA